MTIPPRPSKLREALARLGHLAPPTQGALDTPLHETLAHVPGELGIRS